MKIHKDAVLVVGDEKLAFSIAVCLLQAGHPVTLLTKNQSEASATVDMHFSDLAENTSASPKRHEVVLTEKLSGTVDFNLAIVITPEDLDTKRSAIVDLEKYLPPGAVIAVNTESIALSKIQDNAVRPGRIIGANWVEPAHTTFFLEIIANDRCGAAEVDHFFSRAKTYWQKDPYILRKDSGIRSRMMSAMVREAFYLLENGYVSLEDVDRACRNDPGYYLPFAGHCRYMDLMGTFVYGAVMKDLNPELSRDTHIPAFFTRIVEEGGQGVKTNKGFYVYKDDEVESRAQQFRKFSYEINEIIAKYPFGYLKERKQVAAKAVSNL